jgi:sucrose-6-phosphate hydrolase SacC (GH32 family)
MYSPEIYRPKFHFTTEENWLNDPNGCVYYDGEYHLFFQHNPEGTEWGNMTWGHAVSPDLVHWQQLPHALLPYAEGFIFSGSAVVDWNNTSGLGDGNTPPMVCLFTHARMPFGQALAYSLDRGRNWSLYNNGEHVLPNQGLDLTERDPKIFWYAPSGHWTMVLWVQQDQVRFFSSPDLIHWEFSSDFNASPFFECPDLFELPVGGNEQLKKWVLHDANLTYWIGSFDGKQFIPESEPLQGEHGFNFYAAQTWNNTGGRVVQIAWMRGGEYPNMPFNQQMSFPCELSLRRKPDGERLCRYPVKEIATLYDQTSVWKDVLLQPGENPLNGMVGELFDIKMEIELKPEGEFQLSFYGQTLRYTRNTLSCLGRTAPLYPQEGNLHLRLLIDRTSLEFFGNQGELSMSSCFLPDGVETGLELISNQAVLRLNQLVIHKLRSARIH